MDDHRTAIARWIQVLMFGAVLQLVVPTIAAATSMQFDFGPRGTVRPDDTYDTTRGYGFEPTRESEQGPRFSVRLPEGNYRVSIRLGAKDRASKTTVAAETRRLMLENIVAPRGRFVDRSFIVNVRTAALVKPEKNAPGGMAVRLKERERDSLTWDDKLTLEFIGEQAAVASLSIAAVNVPTLYLAGDSTVTDQAAADAASWGQVLPRFFTDSIAIANHAESGETLKSFLTSLRLDKVLEKLQRGDWLLIQFGHNDQKAQWPQTYAEAATTYRAYLRAYVAEARRRGATPILVTSPERGKLDSSGSVVTSHGDYPDAVRAVAREESVALIDLNAASKVFYETLGEQRIALAFTDEGRDRTHHSNYGAYELARAVVTGIRATEPRLVTHLAPD